MKNNLLRARIFNCLRLLYCVCADNEGDEPYISRRTPNRLRQCRRRRHGVDRESILHQSRVNPSRVYRGGSARIGYFVSSHLVYRSANNKHPAVSCSNPYIHDSSQLLSQSEQRLGKTSPPRTKVGPPDCNPSPASCEGVTSLLSLFAIFPSDEEQRALCVFEVCEVSIWLSHL